MMRPRSNDRDWPAVGARQPPRSRRWDSGEPGVGGAGIVEALKPAPRRRRLRVPPAQAARQILAGSTGVVLTFITQPADEMDLALCDQVRDAVTTTPRRQRRASGANGVAASAIALATALDDETGALSPTEGALLRDWLTRVLAGVLPLDETATDDSTPRVHERRRFRCRFDHNRSVGVGVLAR
jgi:hypothetical protein